jgi:hypothetical protein
VEDYDMESNGKSFVEHWNWAAEKGLMNRNTANALRAAATQVLSIEENWEAIDIASIDVEELLKRFEHLRGKNFKPESLNSYKRRFRLAVASYFDYARNPSGWKPTTQERQVRRDKNGTKRPSIEQLPLTGSSDISIKPVGEGFVDYPFPLRQGLIVQLRLPTDLKLAEVKRLTAFMTTVAADYEPTEVAS